MLSLKNIKTVVIGLDGLGVGILKKIIKIAPFLNNFKMLLDSKFLCSVSSELPELSSVNWTSFYTAKGPEDHGIFGFVHIDPTTYNSYIVDFTHVKTPTLFDHLSDMDLVCKVINLPNTYPAKPIKGVLISGFVAESFEDSIYPKFLIPILKSMKYKLEVNAEKAYEDKEEFFKDLFITLESRKRVIDLFWQDLVWNLFVVVLTEFDRMAHFFVKELLDPTNKWHGACVDILKKIDQILGEVFERFEALPEPKRLIVMSDHGFDESDVEVDINVWLKQQGFLYYCATPKNELDSSVIDEETYAFALDPGRIYIHRKDRFLKGRVDKLNYSSILKEVKDALSHLTYKGRKVIKIIFSKEELYPNSDLVNVPDLICLPQKGFDLKAKFNRDQVFGYFGRNGVHTSNDALFWDSLGESISRIRESGDCILRYFKGKVYV